MNEHKPKLYLIPTPIGENEHNFPLSEETRNVLMSLRHFLVENTRSAIRFLKAAGYNYNIENVVFNEVNEHNQFDADNTLIQPLFDGFNIGLLSEAGLPCIADPGNTVVMLAHQNGFPVVPLSGTSSIFKALMASGMNGQQFTFHGYLPIDKAILRKRLKEIELSAQRGYTQIFMETPYRNDRLTEFMVQNLKPETILCIAAGIDSTEMFIKSRAISQWKKSLPKIKGIPAVFLIGG